MNKKEYKQSLKKLTTATQLLHSTLEEKILGKTLTSKSTFAGNKPYSESIAIDINPNEQGDLLNATSSMVWTVTMKEKHKTNRTYEVGLVAFVEQKDITTLFRDSFRGIDLYALKREHQKKHNY